MTLNKIREYILENPKEKIETLNLLNESYKKAALTNLKNNIDLKIITEEVVKDIILMLLICTRRI